MKTYLIGYTPDQAGQEALMLGLSMYRTQPSSLVICTICPQAWGSPLTGGVDKEYNQFIIQQSEETLNKARTILGDLPHVTYIKHANNSVTQGLMEAALNEEASMIIMGSARHGALGRPAIGGVTDELLHSSDIPVAVAPRDFRPRADTVVTRLTVAYSGLEAAKGTVLEALGISNELGVPLRLVCFAVRDRQMYPSLAGFHAEKTVIKAWREQAEASLSKISDQLAAVSPAVQIDIAEGETWDDALDSIEWQTGEILALGSSRMGKLKKVFLGSNANKIIRSSPVPVLVLPKLT